jgi:hypothetical protein
MFGQFVVTTRSHFDIASFWRFALLRGQWIGGGLGSQMAVVIVCDLGDTAS